MIDNQFKARGFLVWGVCALFFLYEFFLRTVIGTYQCAVTNDLCLTNFQFSLLSTTIFLLLYGLMQIPAGLIASNFGLKKTLLVGAGSCAISSFGFAYADSYATAVMHRMFMGFGASFGFICLLISVHDWMPRRYSAIFIGLSQFIGTLGPMIAAGPLEALSTSSALDWRTLFMILGAIGVVLTLLVLLFVENNQHKAGNYTILQRPERVSVSLKRLFTRAQPWYIAIVSSGLYFTIEYLSENEGRTFLMLKGVSLHDASYMLTISWIGYAIGCPLLGFLSDMLERRKIILVVCSAIGLLAISLILYAHDADNMRIGFFLLGISAAGQSIGFATMAEQFKTQFVAVGFGLNNAMITVISSINAPAIGLFLDRVKQGDVAALDEYLVVFNILIAAFAIAMIYSLFFVKETYAKSVVDFNILKPKK